MRKFRKLAARLVLAVALLVNAASVTAQTNVPGYEELFGPTARAGASAPVPLIVEVAPKASAITDVGSVNALNDARAAIVDRANSLRAGSARQIGESNLVALELTQAEFDALLAGGEIVKVFPNERRYASLERALPWIRGPQAQAKGATGLGAAVVIIDSGVLSSHTFLGGRVVAEACFSSPLQGSTSTCANGAPVMTGPGSGAPCNANGCDHGTHVAGIAAGSSSARNGAAPKASIIALKVFSRLPDSACSQQRPAPCISAWDSDILAALDYVLNTLSDRYPVAAVNLSLGGGSGTFCPSSAYSGRIDALRRKGIATVIASGNEGFRDAVAVPACAPSAITVGASAREANTIANFSNSGEAVDLLAPGVHITSSVSAGPYAYDSFDGTSMAAPMVAGILTAMQSYVVTDVSTAESTLKSTGVMMPTLNPSRLRPRIDFLGAVNALDASIPAGEFVWMRDTLADTGKEPDPATAGQSMSASPAIFVRNQRDCGTHVYDHQNPEFGQPNFVCVELKNDGKTTATGTLQIYIAHANIDVSAAWTLIGSVAVTAPARYRAIVEIPWANVPRPGHYCLLARWVPSGGSPTLSLPGGIDAAVRRSNDLVWHNVNIVDLRAQSASEVVFQPGSRRQTTIAVEIDRLDPTFAGSAGNLVIDLGVVTPGLEREPTSRRYRYDGRYVMIPLEPGVYYIRDVPLGDAGDTNPKITFMPRALEGRHGRLLKVTLRTVPDIATDKRGVRASVPTLTYILQLPNAVGRRSAPPKPSKRIVRRSR